jgi:hypothetical protein
MQDAGRTRERLVGVALAGAVLLNFPLLYLFSHAGPVLGMPGLFVYVFLVWALLVALVALIIHAPPGSRGSGIASGETDGEPPHA